MEVVQPSSLLAVIWFRFYGAPAWGAGRGVGGFGWSAIHLARTGQTRDERTVPVSTRVYENQTDFNVREIRFSNTLFMGEEGDAVRISSFEYGVLRMHLMSLSFIICFDNSMV